MAEEVWKQVAPQLVSFVVALVIAFLAVARAGLIDLVKAWAADLRARTTENQRQTALGIIAGVVDTVEQLYKKGVIQKPAKFDEAFKRARAGLEEAHLNPTDNQISDMIEAAVKVLTDMGTEFKRELTTAPIGGSPN